MEGLGNRIKGADLVYIVLGEPDLSSGVDGNIPGSGTRRRDGPLRDGRADRIVDADAVCDRHGEPDLAGTINPNEKGLTVASRERNDGHPSAGTGIKQG